MCTGFEKAADFDDKSSWDEQFDWIANTLLRMKRAFKKYL